MTMTERVKSILQTRKGKEVGHLPSPKLQVALAKSGVENSIEELSELAETQVKKEIIEEGKKMVIVARWPKEEGGQNQLIVSVREDSISYIGSYESDQYLRLEDQEVFDKELNKDYLARTFANPSIIEVKDRS